MTYRGVKIFDRSRIQIQEVYFYFSLISKFSFEIL